MFHQEPRDSVSAGCAGFQPAASLYTAAGAAVTGVLYAGASEQAANVAAALSAHKRRFGFMTARSRPASSAVPLVVPLVVPWVTDSIAVELCARARPSPTNP